MTLKVFSSHKMDKKQSKGEYLEILLRPPKTIFSTKDVALLWGEFDELEGFYCPCSYVVSLTLSEMYSMRTLKSFVEDVQREVSPE